MNYSGIVYNDIANGPGIRSSLFVSGCSIQCPDCFNKEVWDYNYGKEFTDEVEYEFFSSVADDRYSGISILGGEPLDTRNIRKVHNICKRFRYLYGNTKSIWLYTGFIFYDLLHLEDTYNSYIYSLLPDIDVIVDGPFKKELKDISLRFRGSSNQRLIDVKKTIRNNFNVVLYED